jgi:hypothetical protein
MDETVRYLFPDEADAVKLVWWRTAAGDDLRRALPEYPDSSWMMTPGSGLWVLQDLPPKGVVWYRKAIFLPEPVDSFQSLALYMVASVAACEIYWDGELIARNGMPSSSPDNERAGRSGFLVPVPRRLSTTGRHLIALRVSNTRAFSGLIESPLQIGYLTRLRGSLSISQALSFLFAGMFVIAALFHSVVLFGKEYRWSSLFFSGFCLSSAAYMGIRGALRYFQIDLSRYYLLALVNDIPWVLMMGLLPAFFLFEFSAPFRRRLSVAIGGIALLVVLLPRLVPFGLLPPRLLDVFAAANQAHAYGTILVSIVVVGWGRWKRRRGSLTALWGLVAFLAGVYGTNRMGLENAWAVGLVALNISLAISLARQMGVRSRRHHEAQLRSARLEVELLKKHIQPHFLLNSLNSVLAWLDEDPETAARLVTTLAGELRMLLAFSGEKVIPLSEEVTLCREHLKLMSLRHEKDFRMEVVGGSGEEMLPPLVIHTLVENGLTHGYRGRDTGRFVLRCEERVGRLVLHLFNDGIVPVEGRAVREGTGLRYVKARLEEAFPGRWELSGGAVEGGWSVTVSIVRSRETSPHTPGVGCGVTTRRMDI